MNRHRRQCASPEDYFRGLRTVLDRIDLAAVGALADLLFEIWKKDRQLFLFGNGGSACTAGHLATDLVLASTTARRPGLRVRALANDPGVITAVANDVDFESVFAAQLACHARPDDVALALSGSGASRNLVRACLLAKERGLALAAMTGFDGGPVGEIADLHLHVPSDNYGAIEDLHLAIGHGVSQALHARITEAVSRAQPRGARGTAKGPRSLKLDPPPADP